MCIVNITNSCISANNEMTQNVIEGAQYYMKSKRITKQFAKKIHIIYIYRKKIMIITDAISSFSDFGLIHIWMG